MASSTSTLKLIVDMVNNTEAKFKQISGDFDAMQQKTVAIRGALQQAAIISGVAFAGLSAIILKSTSDYGEFNAEIQRTGAFVDATEDQLKDFAKAAIDAVEGTKFSALEGAKALGNFVGGEVDAAEASKELGDIINLALITRMDNLQDAVNLGSLALTVFKNDGMETTDVMDIMATVASDVTSQTQSWATALVNSAGAAKGAGFSFKELNIALAEMVRGGANVQTVSTAFNSAVVAMQGPSKQAKEALADVGLTATAMAKSLQGGPITMLEFLKKGFEEANKTGNGFIFLQHVLGKQAAPEFALALGLTNEELKETAGWFDDITGKGEEMTDKLRDAEPPLQKIAGAFNKLSIAVGGAISDAFEKFLNVVEPAITAVTNFAIEHPKLTAVILVGTTALMGLILALSTIGLALIAIKAGLAAVGISSAGALLTFGLWILAIAAVGVAVYLLIKYWDDIKGGAIILAEMVKAAWESIKAKVIEVMAALGAAIQSGIDFMVGLWNGFLSFVKSIWDGIIDVFKGFINFMVGVFAVLMDTLFPGWETVLKNMWNSAVTIFNNVKMAVAGFFAAVGQMLASWGASISAVWSATWNGIKNVFTSIWNAISSAASIALNAFYQKWLSIWNPVKEVFLTIWNAIKAAADAAFGFIRSGVDSMMGPLNKLIDVANKAVSIAKSVGSAVKGGVSSIIERGAQITGLRAAGGPVNPLGTYVVGEKGPELFTPQTYGRITSGGSSGGTQVHIHISGNSFMGKEGVAEEISKQIAYILSRNVKLI